MEDDLGFDFGEAVRLLKKGALVCREGWNGKDMWIELQTSTRKSEMTLPYIFMRTAQGHLVPWLACQTDVLAEDWRIKFNK